MYLRTALVDDDGRPIVNEYAAIFGGRSDFLNRFELQPHTSVDYENPDVNVPGTNTRMGAHLSTELHNPSKDAVLE